jgi:tetratricopeptide (TPR) repeat protein
MWVVVVAALGLGAPPTSSALKLAQAPTGASRGVAGRLANVQRLIEKSSGARQVDASAAPRATQAHEAARRLFREATAAHQAGDDQSASKLLDKATRTMFEAVRLAGAPSSLREKKLRDFAAREESVKALMEALERIGKEKNAQGATGEVAAQVRALVGEARTLRDAGKLDEGRAALDQGYDRAKRAIERQRGGETLVRSLNFATKEDEYHYELDRNDTHRMLVDVLTKEKRAKAGIDRMVTTYTGRAEKLRKDAETQAGGGDFAGAVTTLEQSTKEYIRAIRSTGIYIPG